MQIHTLCIYIYMDECSHGSLGVPRDAPCALSFMRLLLDEVWKPDEGDPAFPPRGILPIDASSARSRGVFRNDGVGECMEARDAFGAKPKMG